jgi:hypothetical protein
MPIKPREQVKEKKQLTQRDDFLAALAFAASGGLYWMAGEYPDFAVVLSPLSLVLGGIGVGIVLSMLHAASKRKHKR